MLANALDLLRVKGFLAYFFQLVQAEQDGEISVPLFGHPQWLRHLLEAGLEQPLRCL